MSDVLCSQGNHPEKTAKNIAFSLFPAFLSRRMAHGALFAFSFLHATLAAASVVADPHVLHIKVSHQGFRSFLMNGRHRFPAMLAGLFATLVVVSTASATTLTLDTGKTLALEPGGSGVFTFSMTNDEGAIEDNFLAWAMGIQVVPVGSVSGTMFFGSGTEAKPVTSPLATEFTGALAQPATNPMPAGDVEVTEPLVAQLALGASINGSTTYTLLNITALESLGTVDSLGSYNLGSLTFSASPDAAGEWAVFAVQQGGSFYKTYWTDSELADIDFGNLPRGLSGSNTSLQIGTISVTAVPEPSSLLLAGSALVAAGWFGWRSRRQPTVVEA